MLTLTARSRLSRMSRAIFVHVQQCATIACCRYWLYLRWRLDKYAFVAACREGGLAISRALRQLDQSFHALLYRECRRVIRDPDLASDLVQDTFIKVWQRCATYQGDSELLPWIRAVMRNTTIDRLRVPAREVAFDEAEDDVIASQFLPRAAHSVPEDNARAAESANCFARCWERFAEDCPGHAAVVAWIAEDGLNNQQIAALLERSPGATREYIRQCRKRARKYLAEWYALSFGAEQ